MASSRPASRYASVGSRSSSSSSSASPADHSNNLPALKRLVANSGARRQPQPDPTADGSSRALIAAGKGKSGQNFGSMVRKLMEKKSNPKARVADRVALVVPANLIAEDLKKNNSKGSNLSALHRKLFHKGGGSADRTAGKALTEVKANTRTLAMVLRSERELLGQNKEYEAEILQLQLLVEEKNREVDKLKDLCLKQREEIKALKDAILFPDVMNSQLQELLQKQGSELKQAKQVIPTLQRQVSSLTGKIECLVKDLAEVKADKYAARTYLDRLVSSPRTPISVQETANTLEYSSGEAITSEYGSPDELFLKDFNPCLTPHFSKTQSREYNELSDYGLPDKDMSYEKGRQLSSDVFSNYRGVMLSKSTERCQRPGLGSCTGRKICKSDESKWLEKPTCPNLL